MSVLYNVSSQIRADWPLELGLLRLCSYTPELEMFTAWYSEWRFINGGRAGARKT